MAKSSSVVRKELEKEIHLLRETHARNLQSQDNRIVEHAFLGKEGQPFSFGDLSSEELTPDLMFHPLIRRPSENPSRNIEGNEKPGKPR